MERNVDHSGGQTEASHCSTPRRASQAMPVMAAFGSAQDFNRAAAASTKGGCSSGASVARNLRPGEPVALADFRSDSGHFCSNLHRKSSFVDHMTSGTAP